MNARLQQDLQGFFRIYEGRVSQTLHEQFPSQIADIIERALDGEVELLRDSVLNRLAEESAYR